MEGDRTTAPPGWGEFRLCETCRHEARKCWAENLFRNEPELAAELASRGALFDPWLAAVLVLFGLRECPAGIEEMVRVFCVTFRARLREVLARARARAGACGLLLRPAVIVDRALRESTEFAGLVLRLEGPWSAAYRLWLPRALRVALGLDDLKSVGPRDLRGELAYEVVMEVCASYYAAKGKEGATPAGQPLSILPIRGGIEEIVERLLRRAAREVLRGSVSDALPLFEDPIDPAAGPGDEGGPGDEEERLAERHRHARMIHRMVRYQVSRLPEQQRRVLLAVEVERKTHAEIARAEGCTSRWVASLHRRAVRTFQKNLRKMLKKTFCTCPSSHPAVGQILRLVSSIED